MMHRIIVRISRSVNWFEGTSDIRCHDGRGAAERGEREERWWPDCHRQNAQDPRRVLGARRWRTSPSIFKAVLESRHPAACSRGANGRKRKSRSTRKSCPRSTDPGGYCIRSTPSIRRSSCRTRSSLALWDGSWRRNGIERRQRRRC